MIKPLHIGITGYIATEHVSEWLTEDIKNLPTGKTGAPLTGVLIGELLKQGHKVSAFTTDPALYTKNKIVKTSGPNFDFYICPARPRAWRFNKFRLGRAIDAFAFEKAQLLKAIKIAKPDFIHAHWTYEFAQAAITSGLPHLITCHDAPAVILRYNTCLYRAIHYLMARSVFNKGKQFSAVSDYLAESVQAYTNKSIAIIPNPIANFVLETGRIRTNPTTKRLGLICNGWDTRKNAKPSLLAFAKFHEQYPDSEIHLFGHGFGINESAEHWCKQQELNVNMFFHGATPHKQLIEQLNNLDLFLHPALEETFCVVVTEAMALGLPIVAGKHSGAIPSVVGFNENPNHIYCAVLTDVSNPDKIFLAIEQSFDHRYKDRSKLGYERARQFFTAEIVNKNYEHLYQEILLKQI